MGGSGIGDKLNELVNQRVRRLREQLAAARSALTQAEGALDSVRLEPAELEAVTGQVGAAGGGADLAALRASVEAVDSGTSQVAILNTLMTETAKFAPRVALFIARGDTFTCWAASGFTQSGGTTDQQVKAFTLPARLTTALRTTAETQQSYRGGPAAHSDNDKLFEGLGGISPAELVAIPIKNKGRVAGVFYADSASPHGGLTAADGLDILVRVAGNAVELLPVRPKAPAKPAQPAAAAAQPAAAPAQPAPAQPAPAAVPAQPAAPAAALSEEEQKLHDAARRFARLLVSEIKLYNEAKVVEGRKNKDLYQRLKEDIDRSRQMYGQRVSPQIASSTDYFQEELVKQLAEGDSSALGT